MLLTIRVSLPVWNVDQFLLPITCRVTFGNALEESEGTIVNALIHRGTENILS